MRGQSLRRGGDQTRKASRARKHEKQKSRHWSRRASARVGRNGCNPARGASRTSLDQMRQDLAAIALAARVAACKLLLTQNSVTRKRTSRTGRSTGQIVCPRFPATGFCEQKRLLRPMVPCGSLWRGPAPRVHEKRMTTTRATLIGHFDTPNEITAPHGGA